MTGLYHLGDVAAEDVQRLATRALEIEDGAVPRRFPGRALGLLFLSPSLRTQASFQRAAARLGLDLVQLSGGANGVWELETDDGAVMDRDKVEHVREAAGVLGRYVDVLAIRAFARFRSLEEDLADPLLNAFRRHAGVPVVNMESALWHPCQSLADWATLDLAGVPRRAKLVLTWAWHPKALPHAVPNSTLCMAAQRGMDVVLLRPAGYDLRDEVLAEARRLAAPSGGRVTVTDDREAAYDGAAAVYAKSWGSLDCWGDAPAEAARRAGLRDWRVTSSWMRRTDDAHFMHCLPVRRNVVVDDDVLDGPGSLILDQAENRLHAQTALLEEIVAAMPAPRGADAREVLA
ncbi:MAG: N-acetylornithine carbamoyltransferase [bacterium]